MTAICMVGILQDTVNGFACKTTDETFLNILSDSAPDIYQCLRSLRILGFHSGVAVTTRRELQAADYKACCRTCLILSPMGSPFN